MEKFKKYILIFIKIILVSVVIFFIIGALVNIFVTNNAIHDNVPQVVTPSNN